MKTLSTIFIVATFFSLTMTLENKEVLLADNEEIPEAELDINFEELFHLEETPGLSLEEIPYEEIEEEMIIDFLDVNIPEADLQIDIEELFKVTEEPELSIEEIEFLEMEVD